MSEDNDFFDDVFDDPEDDPLLGSAPSPADESVPEEPAPDEPDQQGPPSWMSEESNANGASSSEAETETDPTRKRIVVDQEEGDAGTGIDALNEAVGQGWRLVRISLARPDGEQAATQQAAHRFVATLEQERPQSLFDFGARA